MKKIPLTPKDIGTIEAAAGFGLKMEKIAKILGMSRKTLQRKMKDPSTRDEIIDALDRGIAIAELNVAKTAYNMAVDGRHPEMSRFWLRARAGWREKDAEETPVDSQPVNVNIVNASLPEAQSKRETVSLLREALGLPKATKTKDDPGFSGGQGNE